MLASGGFNSILRVARLPGLKLAPIVAMLTPTPPSALILCLVSDAEPVRAAVRVCCLPPNRVEVYSLAGFLDPDNTVSATGETVLAAVAAADAVLVDWSMERAPLINTLCYEVRRRAARHERFTPLIALCGGSQEEMIAARAAGADEAMGFPIYLPVVQACIAAHQRKAEAVRRATSARLVEKLEEKQEAVQERAEAFVEELTSENDAPEPEAVMRAEALVEEIAEEMIEEVEEELVLLDDVHDVAEVGPLRLDRTAYRLHIHDAEVELTPKEFELLSFLMDQADALCTRDQILDAVWGIDFETGTNMVEVYMHFLRKKLEAHGLDTMIQTVRGRGYRLSALTSQTV